MNVKAIHVEKILAVKMLWDHTYARALLDTSEVKKAVIVNTNVMC